MENLANPGFKNINFDSLKSQIKNNENLNIINTFQEIITSQKDTFNKHFTYLNNNQLNNNNIKQLLNEITELVKNLILSENELELSIDNDAEVIQKLQEKIKDLEDEGTTQVQQKDEEIKGLKNAIIMKENDIREKQLLLNEIFKIKQLIVDNNNQLVNRYLNTEVQQKTNSEIYDAINAIKDNVTNLRQKQLEISEKMKPRKRQRESGSEERNEAGSEKMDTSEMDTSEMDNTIEEFNKNVMTQGGASEIINQLQLEYEKITKNKDLIKSLFVKLQTKKDLNNNLVQEQTGLNLYFWWVPSTNIFVPGIKSPFGSMKGFSTFEWKLELDNEFRPMWHNISEDKVTLKNGTQGIGYYKYGTEDLITNQKRFVSVMSQEFIGTSRRGGKCSKTLKKLRYTNRRRRKTMKGGYVYKGNKHLDKRSSIVTKKRSSTNSISKKSSAFKRKFKKSYKKNSRL
jgi:hypothetical protein